MEIREIRIGNMIEYLTVQNPDRWEEILVSPVTFGRLSMEPLRFRPIELTPEWLERFGFEKEAAESFASGSSAIFNVYRKGKLTYNTIQNQWWYGPVIDAPLRYVHQLQNLFYSLTGKELAIDKTSLI